MDWGKHAKKKLSQHNPDLTDEQSRRAVDKLRKKRLLDFGKSAPSPQEVNAAAEEVRNEDRIKFKRGQKPSPRFDGA